MNGSLYTFWGGKMSLLIKIMIDQILFDRLQHKSI
jgi:hypothetical protein